MSTNCARILSVVALLACRTGLAQSDKKPTPDRIVVYKEVEGDDLELHIFEPKAAKGTDAPRSAIVFFFGGGWVGGTPAQFYPQCRHLAKQGMVAISTQYRTRKSHDTTPIHCVQDGKSALRWVRKHAEELNIDPNRIAAGGGSAGGHVAAAVATVPGLDEPGEDTSVSCRPDLLVLFNPVYDNGPDGYGYNRVKDRYREISPLHNLSADTPPAIVFLGTEDKLIPVETAQTFQKKMQSLGIDSELDLYEGEPHGFFNPGRGDGSSYHSTVAAMDRFLTKHGFLPSKDESQK